MLSNSTYGNGGNYDKDSNPFIQSLKAPSESDENGFIKY